MCNSIPPVQPIVPKPDPVAPVGCGAQSSLPLPMPNPVQTPLQVPVQGPAPAFGNVEGRIVDLAARYLQAADRDGDQSISTSEVAGMGRLDDRVSGSLLVAASDTNRDGAASRQELEAYMRRFDVGSSGAMPGLPGQPTIQLKPGVAGDGVLTNEEHGNFTYSVWDGASDGFRLPR